MKRKFVKFSLVLASICLFAVLVVLRMLDWAPWARDVVGAFSALMTICGICRWSWLAVDKKIAEGECPTKSEVSLPAPSALAAGRLATEVKSAILQKGL